MDLSSGEVRGRKGGFRSSVEVMLGGNPSKATELILGRLMEMVKGGRNLTMKSSGRLHLVCYFRGIST